MKEHAKLLEHYCRLFDETSQKINIFADFQNTMVAGGKFSAADLQDYMQYKMKSQMASDLGS